MTNRIKS